MYHLFDVIGVELEYMIVREEDLTISPIAEQIFLQKSGSFEGEVNCGAVSWSNELVSHVIELKTSQPVHSLDGMGAFFHKNVQEINSILKHRRARLLPTASHPFMDPFSETNIWPHDSHEIYNLYNRIFNCQGHGWSNVQSTHINLPFHGDEEFARLHAAIRLLLPVIPGLCASSPLLEGRFSGYRDARLYHYQNNQKEIPSIAGKIIPEAIFDYSTYCQEVFNPINNALRPYDTEHILDHHFVNSRGAIARFDRGAIEIRLMDIQECPAADLSLVKFIVEVLKLIVNEEFGSFHSQSNWHEDELYPILQDAIKDAETAMIVDEKYLSFFGLENKSNITIGDFFNHLLQKVKHNLLPEEQYIIEHILKQGTLATRILHALDNDFSNNNILRVYGELADCLASNQLFDSSSHLIKEVKSS